MNPLFYKEKMNSIIIDTDPGVDDALAIMMAAKHPQTHIKALLTTGGNVGLGQTTHNALLLKDLLQLQAPVYPGCQHPLVLAAEDAAYVHGKDGFGDCQLGSPDSKAETEHAATALVEIARTEPGQHSLLALGPLTNIALALHLEPSLPELFKRFVVMGGAVTGHGNTPKVSTEFNFFADPEAARFVLDHWKGVELVDWELVTRNALPMETLDQWLNRPLPIPQFYQKISGAVKRYVLNLGADAFYMADPLAMAALLEPELIVAWQEKPVLVELSGEMSRGQSVVDWRGFAKHGNRVNLAMQANTQLFHRMLDETFS